MCPLQRKRHNGPKGSVWKTRDIRTRPVGGKNTKNTECSNKVAVKVGLSYQ